MNVSYNWLKELVDFEQSPEELEKILTMLGIEVEGMIDYRKKYENFYTAEVTKCEKHPNADKLTLCTVSLGKEEKEMICGAPNAAVGQKVVVGVPGAVVPQGGFEIEKRKIRGVKSDGMICSEAELELGDDHSGIMVLPDDAEPGQPMAEYMNLDDVVFEIDLTPNRADCLSHLGVAREIAAYNNTGIKIPDEKPDETGKNIADNFEIEIIDSEKCPRYTGRIVRGINVGESPAWMKARLTAVGLRPINVIVDITNYVLMECGQPLHAFDLDKLEGNMIVVKSAEKGEKFTTLDSKERELDEQMLMICDANKSVAIGGVMGGENSEITTESKNVLIESAYFNPSSVRRTSKKLAIPSDASYRFERGVDFDNVAWANDRAAKLISELAGGTVDKGILDEYPNKQSRVVVTLRYQRARDICGADISNEQIKDILARLNFGIKNEDSESITVEAPSYRVDIEQEIDLVEEIARMYNYDEIEPDFSLKMDLSATNVPEHLSIPRKRHELRTFLVPAGFKEIITQNMIDPASAKLAEDKLVTISNPLGEELSIMRPSLMPSLLKTVERNLRVSNTDLRMFEIGKTFHLVDKSEDTFIPGFKEKEELMAVITGKSAPLHWDSDNRESDFYDIKGTLQSMLQYFHLDDEIEIKTAKDHGVWFSANSLTLIYKDREIGMLGTISGEILKKFDIEIPVNALLIDLDALFKIPGKELKYKPVPPFPGVTRDLAFVLDESVQAGPIYSAIYANGGVFLRSVDIFDVYKGKNIAEGKKSIAFTLYFASPDRTLVDEEVDDSINKIVSAVKKEFNAELRDF